jgi:hypothetical protein
MLLEQPVWKRFIPLLCTIFTVLTTRDRYHITGTLETPCLECNTCKILPFRWNVAEELRGPRRTPVGLGSFLSGVRFVTVRGKTFAVF